MTARFLHATESLPLQHPAVRLRLMATSDLHMHLAAYDYHRDTPCPLSGLALTAGLIAKARAEVPDALLLDNGDFLQGSPLGDFAASNPQQTHPMIAAMAQLGYDAVNIGNHEFSHGIGTLVSALDRAPFPAVSANAIAPVTTRLSHLLQPWTLIRRRLGDQNGDLHDLCIGVIGVLPPETAIWDKQAIDGHLTVGPMTETVAAHLPAVRDAGADVIVVLAHCGPGQTGGDAKARDGAARIAGLAGVDAVIMGHEHMVFPGDAFADLEAADAKTGTLHGKPAVMPGFFGSHLGIIDLVLVRHKAGWQVADHSVDVRPVAERRPHRPPKPLVTPDPAITTLVDPVHHATLTWARRPIGRTHRAIHSFFALVSDCPTVQIVNHAQSAYVSGRLADGPHGHLPVLSATAPFRAGGLGGPDNYIFVPPGELLLRHAVDLYQHPNTIVALRLDGAALRSWLEQSAEGYRTIQSGIPDQPLTHAWQPSFLYDTISGLTYEIDLGAEPASRGGRRIHNLNWQGRPLDMKQDFILATNSYRGAGSGGYAPIDSTKVILAEKLTNREILIDHIVRTLADTAAPQSLPDRAWRFRAMPGTSVTFDTSPLAQSYLEDHPDLDLTPLHVTEDGFLRVRLTL